MKNNLFLFRIIHKWCPRVSKNSGGVFANFLSKVILRRYLVCDGRTPNNPITVLLDSEVSKENVIRLASSMGYEAKAELISNQYLLSLTPVPNNKGRV